MFITTKLTVSMITGEVLEREGYEYTGAVELCKGDSTATSAENDQAGFDTYLQGQSQQQYANQQGVMSFINNILKPQIASGGQGYDTATLNAMRTGATDSLSTGYQQAQQALQNQEVSTNGGSDLPSGVNSQLDAGLLNQEAQDKASTQNQITVANANLKNQNYWNAINGVVGQESMLNPLGYAGAATQGSGAVASLSQANTQAAGPTFGSILGGIAGSGLAALGTGLAPGGALSKLVSSPKPTGLIT